MKKIVAIIKPYMLEETSVALKEKEIIGMTVSEVNGMGRQKGHTELYRGAEYAILFHSKIKLEIVLEDEKVDEIVTLIRASAYTGKPGDGKIFIVPVGQVVRIRTGENNDNAL